MRKIELPRKVVVGEDAIYTVGEVVRDLNLTSPLIISGEVTKKIAEIVYNEIGGEFIVAGKEFNIDEIGNKINEAKRINFVCGVGGGKIIDIAKLYGFKNKIPVVSIPTAASHDGICSSQVALGVGYSIKVNAPIAIVADIKIIKNAPRRLTSSGFGDAISNYTAVLDWKLAKKEINEYYGDYAALLSNMSAEIVMENSKKIFDEVDILVEALISSGVAMAISGSSRPCSGSEHMFSHAIDRLSVKYKFDNALHGEQCGVGTIISAYLHKADWVRIRECLKNVNAPVNAKDLKIEREYIIEALKIAPKIRERYTIFNKHDMEKEAEKILTECEVI